MKKIIIFVIFNAVMILSLHAQTVSNYTFQLDNGITVKMEHCWNHVWVTQSFEALKPKESPVGLSTRTLGELTQSPAFKLYSSGKEVRTQDAKPGNYTMKVSFKLMGKPGTISFDVNNVTVKSQNKTTISVIVYDYQITVDETASSQKGLASFTSRIERYKGNVEQNPTCGVPTFYTKGKHDTPLTPEELNGKTGKIKPGSYDVLLTLGTPDRQQKIWLENFVMKPDVNYNITANLNAGVIEYAGVNRSVKSIHLYPAGVADRQKGAATPEKNLEMMRCEGIATTAPCPPGTYDALINLGNKYEWRKGILVKTGAKTQVK